MTVVKVCGLKRPEDIEAVNEAGCDLAGFIFAKKSRRYVEPAHVSLLAGKLRSDIIPVGVFVNEDVNDVKEIMDISGIRMIQLHGSEDNAYIHQLRNVIGNSANILQAFRIDSEEDIEKVMNSEADLVLVDHGAGGTGESFDWSLLKNMKRDYLLAGGIGPANVKEAIALLHPYGVDASSLLETEGVKDRQKILDYVRNAKEAV